jgi:hypothetical protein
MFSAVIGLLLAATLPRTPYWATVENRDGSAPRIATEATASVGDTVFERYRYSAVRVAVPRSGFEKNTGLGGRTSIPAGEPLPISRDDGKVVACSVNKSNHMNCMIDRDGDGKFERLGEDAGFVTQKIEPPVEYDRAEVAVSDGPSFRRSISYVGRTSTNLRFGYREFVNDMARPAFAEELTFEVPTTFPDIIVFRDLQIEVLGVSNAGLRYRIVKDATLLQK